MSYLRRALVAPLLLASYAGLVLGACAGSSGGSQTLLVGAASSLEPPFTELAEVFQEETGSTVAFAFGATGNLARQIEQGAPMDVFAAADVAFMERLEEQGLIMAGTRRTHALGRLALVSSRKAGVEVTSLEALLEPEVRYVAMANPELAPYGAAARQALESAGLWARLQPRVVYGESVRQALQFVQTGNAEAGLVARSIANAEGVSGVPVDQALHEPLAQTIGVVSDTARPELARRFVELVTGPQGQAVLARYGYSPPAGQGGP